jgi:hypothetical protein
MSTPWAAASRRPARRAKGTSFRLVLPLTTAVTQVVMLRCGERAFGRAVHADRDRAPRARRSESRRGAYRQRHQVSQLGQHAALLLVGDALLREARPRHCHRVAPGGGDPQRGSSAWSCMSTRCWATRKWWSRTWAAAVARAGPGGHDAAALGPAGADLQPSGPGHAVWRATRARQQPVAAPDWPARPSRRHALTGGGPGAAGAWWWTTR